MDFIPVLHILNAECENVCHTTLTITDGLAGGVIKVADFGLSEDMYGSNYYRRSESETGERVPMRWMAPESIEMYFYDESTDVVRRDV